MNDFTLPSIPHDRATKLVAPRETSQEIRPRPFAMILLAVGLRLVILWFVMARFPHGWFYTHGIELGTLAQSLEAGRGLSSPFGGSTGPTALLAPGYPLWIALLFRVFGPLTSAAAVAVMSTQILFSAGTLLLMMRVAQRCFGARAANRSGAFWAVSLPLLWMPTIFWETCLSALLLIGMLVLALHCARSPRLPQWGIAGAYAALASLVNPALLLSLFAMVAWASWQTRRAPRHLLLAVVVFCAVFAPWPIRNARLLHAFIPLRSTVGLELWMGNREGASGFLDESVFPLFNRREYQQYVALGEAAYMRDKTALAESYIRAHPAIFLERTTVRMVRFWTGTGTQHGSFVFALHALVTTTLGGAGLWRLVRQRRFRLACLFFLPLLLFPLPYYLTHAEFRYRLVIDPLLTVLGGYALSGGNEGFPKLLTEWP